MSVQRRRHRAAYFRKYNRKAGRRASAREAAGERTVLAIDGEGYTQKDGSHLYVYMAASSAEGLVSELRNPAGLTADEVFGWLLSLPPKAILVGFALGYDRTKWLESWPDERIWRLVDPERRQGRNGPLPVDCEGWRVNLVATRMTVRRREEPKNSRCVWDVWKFFQSSFVKALERWDVGTKKERAFIQRQKDRRGDFKGIGKTEECYCQDECRLLAVLVTKLLAACEEAGLSLSSYYGPGSLAALVLRELGADLHKARLSERMVLAVYAAYFGGRFECSRVGPIRRARLFAWDIVSAYPWAFTLLPCMKPSHGTWVRRKNGSLKGCHPLATCCRFVVGPHKNSGEAWGPLPHRLPDGNILFPLESAGGWVWRRELEAGQKLHPGVRVVESWTWRPTCDCEPPFATRVKELFALRRQWGKAARGLVLKLLLNSLYGKSAQRVGKGRFRCMVRAGLITSTVRARLLEAVTLAKERGDVLELATDSVLSTRPIAFPKRMLGTELGQWEAKDPGTWRGGVFLMRAGLRFPLREARGRKAFDKLVGDTAARGVGPRVLAKNRGKVMRQWQREPMAPVTLETPSFFHGAKLSVRAVRAEVTDEDVFEHKGHLCKAVRDPLYGRWTSETRTLKYDAKPKRESMGPGFELQPWRLPRGAGCESVPYGVAGQSAIGDELDRMRELQDDQPDQEGVRML